MSQVDISIIIPVYKVPEKYLKKCIESVQNQTYENIQIVLVDDGSPDECGKICDKYARNDSRVKVIHKENQGLSAARNTGVKESDGTWVMFVDGDDWIEADMCEKMFSAAQKYNVELVMCGMKKEYEHISEPYGYYLENEKPYFDKECKWLQEQLLHFNGNIAMAYCKLILKDILVRNNIYHDENLKQGAEGIEFNLRLFEKIKSAIFLKMYLYHYVYNEKSISASYDEENIQYVLKCFEKIGSIIEQSEDNQNLKNWFNNRLIYVIITAAISGYFNPSNTDKYKIKKLKYKKYLQNSIVDEAIKSNNTQGLSKARKIAFYMIKYHMFFLLNIMAKIRKYERGIK